MTQTLTISDWHPTSSANAQRRHWRDVQKRHHVDRDMAWASAMQAGWTAVTGKVKLTITLVYPRRYRVDADNLAARCKGLIDGLKSDHRNNHGRLGWFADDSTEWLELQVTAVVEPGRKETRICLEAMGGNLMTTDNGTALAVRELSDKAIQTRIDLNRKAGYGLEKANPAQLNLIFLYCQKYQLLPGDDVTLYENKPWLTLQGSVKVMRRHDEYRGFDCKPLSATTKAEWGYDPDDIVIECQIRTSTWGTISARGKVSKEEIAGIKIEGRRLNYVASIHPVEMAEKRAIQRAERLAFGADAMIDEDEIEQVARTVISERQDPQRRAKLAAEHERIFGNDEDGTAYADQPASVPTREREVVDAPRGQTDAELDALAEQQSKTLL